MCIRDRYQRRVRGKNLDMSSRALKQRLKQQLLEQPPEPESESESEEEEQGGSLFALLGEDSSEEEEEREEEAEPVTQAAEADVVAHGEVDQVELEEPQAEKQELEAQPEKQEKDEAPSGPSKAKKKKKRARKKRGGGNKGGAEAEQASSSVQVLGVGAAAVYRESEVVTVTGVHHEDVEPYYTIRMQDGREKQTPASYLSQIQNQTQTEQAPAVTLAGVLAVHPPKLDPMHEMKQLFGARVVNGDAQSGGGRNRHARRVHTRRTVTCTPQNDWPRMTDGLTLERVHGTDSFRYKYSGSYHFAEQWHVEAVASMDPNNFVLLLQQYPYHVPTLLQLASVMRSQGQADQSDGLVQRALYALEYGWEMSGFRPLSGSARLDANTTENKPLFDALWQRMLAVGRQGCFGAALAFCKLILSLSPNEDPCGILQCIDYYAIRAREYHTLLQLCAGFESVKSLSLLPNMAYSSAFAQFRLGNQEQADRSLQQAMALFPGVLVMLVNEAGSTVAGREWQPLLAHPHLTKNSPPSSATLRFLQEIFVKRNVFLWKQADVMQWLLSSAEQLIGSIDDEEVGDLVSVSHDQYPASSTNRYRHLSYQEFTDTVEFIPEDEPDPVAPAGMRVPQEPAAYHPDPDVNVAAAFLESMLPWNHAPTDETAAPNAAENAEIDAWFCLLYTSDAADEEDSVDLGGRRIIKKKKYKGPIRR
eukprot:TRINITY_DN3587_c0_g1_i1.p1 TRINITY_DN3587_c0_g1~~TRINITY_DN3587_c0_g1_i1.p1  ORF type:complete len:703 (+),score=197.04 TRINITY_DN3587_c0_g1_i1:184-2292(+)